VAYITRHGINNKRSQNLNEHFLLPQSDLAEQIIKDPYKLDFLTIYNEAEEKEIENALVNI